MKRLSKTHTSLEIVGAFDPNGESTLSSWMGQTKAVFVPDLTWDDFLKDYFKTDLHQFGAVYELDVEEQKNLKGVSPYFIVFVNKICDCEYHKDTP